MRRLAAVMFAGAVMIGCHYDKDAPKDKPTTMPTLYGTAAQGPLAAESKPTLVQSGEVPLAYRVESNVTIRITDMNAGDTVATAALKAGDFVAVTADNGIVMGGERIVKGPLPEGHRYGIYVEQPSANVFRSGAIVPGTR
jgi:hypothetical protein